MLSYSRYPDLDFTHFVSEGETTIENWLDTVQQYSNDGMTTRELYDFRHRTNLFSIEETGMIVNRSVMVEHLHPEDGKTAILVDSVEKYSLAEIYAVQAKNYEGLSNVRVFFALGEAIEWLGRDVVRCL